MKSSHMLLVILVVISFFNGGGYRKIVHDHFINPQNKLHKNATSSIKEIKWASFDNDKILVCIYGRIKKKSDTNTGYTTISIFKNIRTSTLKLVDSDKTFLASFNRDMLDVNESGIKLNIKASTITPNCDEITNTNNILVFNSTGLPSNWLINNKQDSDFIYNMINPSPDYTFSIQSYYVLANGIGSNKLGTPYYLTIDTSIEPNSYDTIKGVILYPFAFIFDVITSPLQFIAGHLPWG